MGSYDRLIELLPQKPPFRFVDEVLELARGESIVGAVTFPRGHRVFEGHLPGEPIVPGVILIEALAQVAGLILAPEGGAPLRGYLGEVLRMRFRRAVRPDERVRLRARLAQRFGKVIRFEGVADVGGGEVAAEGEITVVATSL
jgi:3-hydroxymyristoyl/3-hydroxydecanoyl-(acyl carrier protein) dehydratase